jgi:hypothetical protein
MHEEFGDRGVVFGDDDTQGRHAGASAREARV